MEEFQHCPICLEVPEGEIYQCIKGHIICHVCFSKLCRTFPKCPYCRVSLGGGKIRSRILERILDSQHFECKFNDKGCTQLNKRGDITTHANSCSHNPDTHPLCEQLGLKNCNNFRIGCISRSDVVSHFGDVHKLPLKLIPDLVIKGNFIKNWWNRKRKVGETEAEVLRVRSFLIGLVTSEDSETSPLFLVFGKISKITGNLSFLCINVWESNPPKKYKAHFVFHKASTPPCSSSCLSVNEIDPFPIGGSMKVCSIKEAGYFVDESPINFKISMLLRARFGNNLRDYINVTIKEIPDDTPVPKCLEVYLRNVSSASSSVSSPPESLINLGNYLRRNYH